MCGIVGMINYGKSYQTKAREIMMQLLLLDVVRGKESTGIFKAKEKEVDWRKAAVPSWEFFQLEGVDPFFNGLGDWPFIVGHNRWATRGKVTNDNAHPFEEGKICLVHNGTLSSVYQLPDHAKFDVDSNLIAHAINKIGIEETTKKMNGAYALAWYDSKRKNLNLLRNDERPMWLLNIPKEDMHLFGSEIGLLRWVAIRNGYDPGEFKQLESHNLYTFERGEKNPKVKKLEGYVSKYGGWNGGQHRGYLPGSDDDADYGDYPVVAPIQQQQLQQSVKPKVTATVIPFNKSVSAELLDHFKVGQELEFSLADFDDKVYQGGFVPITGDIPKASTGATSQDYIVRGNFNANKLDALQSTKNLLKGTITAITGLKQGKVLVQVKDVVITDFLDPYFMLGAELEEWKKRVSAPEEKKKKVDTALECKQCYEVPKDGKLFMVYKTGGPRNMCLACLHGFNPQHPLLTGQQGTERMLN